MSEREDEDSGSHEENAPHNPPHSPPRDFGKVRVFPCFCGGRCVRPLWGVPKPCDRCGAALTGQYCFIDDHHRLVDEVAREWLERKTRED